MTAEQTGRGADATTGLVAEPPKKKSKRAKQVDKKEERPLKFRNYIPRTPELKDFCLPKVTSADIEDEIDKEIEATIEAAEDQEAVLAIAPRKPNWDLKRDVERKMLVLQARTDRAIVQLIRERIKQDKSGQKATNGKANPEDERSHRDETSLALAREVAKAAPPRSNADSDDEGI
mmetsp:Transcript_50489/g.100477  ORF Transcript_50489/g.100477 Transcript_50489/m.100477 type:complete len:176 (+) Transcript_50489:85-612(+)|eukprot:CAMPEP_0172714192 /NCGR_PEP_ID=MMETSP1074-20121228/65012_1 /TAXON_ID=2916 /ORGANISM="Ceratium fusus, Strain PA161109" /LENGTH=175 /DNA_ID=CAMNT_0013538547 /DNA_START=81 /DNA_END=608 /DNA_ORIENTATION=+